MVALNTNELPVSKELKIKTLEKRYRELIKEVAIDIDASEKKDGFRLENLVWHQLRQYASLLGVNAKQKRKMIILKLKGKGINRFNPELVQVLIQLQFLKSLSQS